METIRETEYVKVIYDEDYKLIDICWLGNCESYGYRET